MKMLLTCVCVAVAVTASSINPSRAAAQDLSAWKGKLEKQLIIKGPVEEGIQGDKGSKFPPKGGTTYDTLTYPSTIEVSDPGTNGEGVIKYVFDARIRKKNFEATVEIGTNDDNIKGEITAKYAFTIGGKVLITEIKHTSGDVHNAGACIVKRLKELNGVSLK